MKSLNKLRDHIILETSDTKNFLIRYCAVCDTKISNKDEWELHVKGQNHEHLSTKSDAELTEVITELIQKTKRLLGSQTKFVTSVHEDVFKFRCILCDKELNSYFSVSDHIMESSHENKVQEYNRLKELRKNACSLAFQENDVPSNKLDRAMPFDLDLANIKKTVDYLSCIFTGELNCIHCKQPISFDFEHIDSHIKKCALLKDKERKESGAEDSSKLSNEENDIVEKFRIFVRKNDLIGVPDIYTHNMENSSIEKYPERLLKEIACIKSFNCLDCQISDTVEQWEKHVTSHHIFNDSAVFTDASYPISCVCLLCESLLYGKRSSVIVHSHFQENMNFFLLSHYLHLSALLKEEADLPKYYRFVSKTARKPNAELKLGLYCLVCDVYCFQKIDKHFTSHKHMVKANLTCDLHFCNSCYVVLYGDNELIKDHQLTSEHIQLKNSSLTDAIDLSLNPKHQFLLITLKLNIEKNLSEYKFHRTLESRLYICDICEHPTDKKEEWNSHLATDSHKHDALNKSKSFPYICIFCKLTIFGTVFNHIAHVTSSEHQRIKNTVIEYYNKNNVSEFNRVLTERNRNYLENSRTDTMSIDDMKKEKRRLLEAKEGKLNTEFNPITEFYVMTLDLKKSNESIVSMLNTFLQETLKKTGLKACKTINCDFCKSFSSEKTGLRHIQSPVHFDKINEYKTSKSNKAVALFCYSCSILVIGPTFIQQRHMKTPTHKSKSLKFIQSLNAPIENKQRTDSVKSNDSVDYKTDDSLKTKSNKVLPDFSNTKAGIFESTNNTKCVKSNEDTNIVRSLSFSSNTSSLLYENEEKSEDETDDLYNIVVSGESDGEEKATSDDELDESLLNELKNNHITIQNKSGEGTESSETKKENNEDREIVRNVIIIKGIPEKVLKNKSFTWNTFSKYGVIKHTFTRRSKPGCLFLSVLTEPEEVFKNLKKNIESLKMKLGTDELVIENDTRNTDDIGIKTNITTEAQLLYSNPKELSNAVEYLIKKYETESNSNESKLKIRKLEDSILRLSELLYGLSVPLKVFIFGSRVTGLATENSDVDIYLQIGASFTGAMHNNTTLQQQLVVLFANSMKGYTNEFRNVTSIPFARVPIVKFTHVKSKLNCDLSFKSGLSTMNSLLVSTYLELDDRIKFIVCAVKLWMKLNELADRNLFTTYAQIWMVLFFLMQPEIAVVPPVLKLRNMLPSPHQHLLIEDWNCTFPNVRNIVWRSSCSLTKEELLLKFFEFYSNDNLINYVMCTLTGIKTEKKYFVEYFESLPTPFNQYKLKVKSDLNLYYKVVEDFGGLCIQDPFDHCHNLTKTINSRKFSRIINLCRQTAEILKSNASHGESVSSSACLN